MQCSTFDTKLNIFTNLILAGNFALSPRLLSVLLGESPSILAAITISVRVISLLLLTLLLLVTTVHFWFLATVTVHHLFHGLLRSTLTGAQGFEGYLGEQFGVQHFLVAFVQLGVGHVNIVNSVLGAGEHHEDLAAEVPAHLDEVRSF